MYAREVRNGGRTNLFVLESLQVLLALRRTTVAVKANARELMSVLVRSAAQRDEVTLEVVAIELGSAEDDRLIHLILANRPNTVLA